MKLIIGTSLLIFLCVQHVENYNILAIFPLHSKSHFVMFERLMVELAERGHEVDVVSHFPQKKSIPRYNDLSVEGSIPILVNNITLAQLHEKSLFGMVRFMTETCGYELCETLFNTSVLQSLKNTTKKYDLLITEIFGTDCMLGFAHIFKIPVIAMTSSVNLPWGSDRFANPDNPSYIPNYFVPYLSEMTLLERVINTVILVGTKITYYVISTKNSDKVAKKFFGEDLPDLEDLAYQTNLFLVNSHFSLNQARPTVPNFIEVGGLHIKQPKPLPEHFENIVQNSSNGVIYLSTGSMLQTESFHPEKLQAMFDAFAELPHKVLWKANTNYFPKGLKIPDNIHFEKWMPQLDILCHPNVKLFVSHGGLMGTQEARHCGIPTLGIPFFADQFLNLKQSEAMGLSIRLHYEEITKETMLNALKRLLQDPKYKINAEVISSKFRDRLNTPIETSVFWVEYVIRHKGAPELRTVAVQLPWYKYFLVDVIFVILGSLAFGIYLVYFLISKLIAIALKRKHKKIKKN